jgi:hypothetical protein
MFYGGWCGTPGIEYDELFRALRHPPPQRQIQRPIRRDASGDPPAIEPPRVPQIHARFPLEADYRTYGERGILPLRRAIEEFEDGVRGGEGAWGVPRPASEQERWYVQFR